MRETDSANLTKVGSGRHGEVYRLDDGRCLKKYRKEKYGEMEYRVLHHSRHYPQFPRVYEFDGWTMIREYCDGPDVREYIRYHGLSRDLAYKLVEIIEIFEELGFSRLDCRLPHLIVTKDLRLKVIDPTRNMDKKAGYPYYMLKGLKDLGCKEQFLKYVKEVRPDYYSKWAHHD